jgi:hypothetical protein
VLEVTHRATVFTRYGRPGRLDSSSLFASYTLEGVWGGKEGEGFYQYPPILVFLSLSRLYQCPSRRMNAPALHVMSSLFLFRFFSIHLWFGPVSYHVMSFTLRSSTLYNKGTLPLTLFLFFFVCLLSVRVCAA